MPPPRAAGGCLRRWRRTRIASIEDRSEIAQDVVEPCPAPSAPGPPDRVGRHPRSRSGAFDDVAAEPRCPPRAAGGCPPPPVRCASASFLVVAPRCGASFSATRSRLIKSLNAAEQQAQTWRGRGDAGCENRACLTRPGWCSSMRHPPIPDDAATWPVRPRRAIGGSCPAGALEDDHLRGCSASAWHESIAVD